MQALIGVSVGVSLGAAWGDIPDGTDGVSLRPPFRRSVNIPIVGGVAALNAVMPLIHKDGEAGSMAGCGTEGRHVCPLDARTRDLLLGNQSPNGHSKVSHKTRNLMDSLSNITLYTLAAQPLGHAVSSSHRGQVNDALVPYEAAAIALGVVNVVKHVAHRSRPYAQYCDPPEEGAMCASDAHLSFYSGHTSTAFALAVSSARVASFLDYKHEGAIKATGLSLAAATGVLRITSDRHYLTDVLVGAGVGIGLGWAVAELHKPKAPVDSRGVVARGQRSTGRSGVALSLPVGPGAKTWISARVGSGFELRLSGAW